MSQIVEMNERHIDQIASIEKNSFLTPWSKSMISNELKNSLAHYYVLENDNKVLAYMGYYKVCDEGHITNIAVLKKCRGQGLSKELLSYVLDAMKKSGIKSATLEVNEHNLVAIKLYESFNFKMRGRRPRYYEGRDDALIYWLDFLED